MRTDDAVGSNGMSFFQPESDRMVVRSFVFAWLFAGAVSAGSVQLLAPVGFVIAASAWSRARRDSHAPPLRRAADVQMVIWVALLSTFFLAAVDADTAARATSALGLAGLTLHGAWALGALARTERADRLRVGALEVGALLLAGALVAAAVSVFIDSQSWGSGSSAWIAVPGFAGLLVMWAGYARTPLPGAREEAKRFPLRRTTKL